MLKQATVENRTSRRHEINVTANLIFDEEPHKATVLDISTGGAKVSMRTACPEKQSHITIDLPFLNELAAKVVWVHGKDCGLQFEDDQDRLSEFLYNLAIYGTA